MSEPGVALRVQTLGGFAVWRAGQRVPPAAWQRRAAGTFFKCLLSAPGHRLARAQAIALLWPEADADTGRRNLRGSLHQVRCLLDGPRGHETALSLIQDEGDDVLVLVVRASADPAAPPLHPEAWLDAAAFRHAALRALAGTAPAACQTALALYGGDYLPDDLSLDADWEEPWLRRERDALRQLRLRLLLHLAGLYATDGQMAEAEAQFRAALQLVPSHEEAATQLMGLLAAQGRAAEALRVYRELRTALKQEFGLVPSPELKALRARLLAQRAAPTAVQLPPRSQISRRPSNLPMALSRFIGRVREHEEVRQGLAQTRLLTLTGMGGCGKTRLALAVAEGMLSHYADGVWWVDLAARTAAEAVPSAVASALGVREEPERPLLHTLCRVLAARRLLLVLDNCEHLIDACAALVEALLAAAPDLTILATSREPLGVAGETVWVTPPLQVPPEGRMQPDTLMRYDAVQLFVERAQAVRPGFALDTSTSSAVTALCRRLDGLPLALELAAARLAIFTVQEVAARLADRFQFLVGGSRTALPRHQTLRATLDWSYGLLDEPQRVLLRRLAVFASGWALPAAEAICVEKPLMADAVPDLLGALVAHSLVQIEQRSASTRFRLLDTVRAYAAERLEDSGEAQAVRDRHLDWCLALAEEAAPRLLDAGQADWLARLEIEHDNLQVALGWAVAAGAGERGLRLATALWRFWRQRAHWATGVQWLDNLLVVHADVAAAIRARALYAVGSLHLIRGAFTTARVRLEESLDLWQRLGDVAGTAQALSSLGNLAQDQCAFAEARDLHAQSLALFRTLDDVQGMAMALNNLGLATHYLGNDDEAEVLLRKSLALHRARGDMQHVAVGLNNLGSLAQDRGAYAQAQALHQECLALWRELGVPRSTAIALSDLALATYHLGDLHQARALLAESLALFHPLGPIRAAADGLERFALVLADQGQLAQAVTLLGAAHTVRTTQKAPPSAYQQQIQEQTLARANRLLGNTVVEKVWSIGHTQPLEKTIRLILAGDDE